MPGEGVHPEGIAEDPDGVTFYVSSARQGTIFRGRLDRQELEIWQPAGVDGRTNSLGMTVDGRGRLLVCGHRSGHLFAYDTRTGALVWRQRVPSADPMLNDVCVVGEHAYVTDSHSPIVWRFPLDGGDPAEWADLGEAQLRPYLNGVVAHEGGLLVAAQGTEVLWRVDLASRETTRLADGIAADGMMIVDDILWACDNNDKGFYLSGYRLSPTVSLVHRITLPTDDTPTTVAHLGGRALVVNSQFIPGREGRAAPPFTVTAVELPGAHRPRAA